MDEMVVKKPLYKIWWFWVVLGIISTVFFGVLGSCADESTYDEDYNSFSDSIASVSTSSPETTEPTEIEHTTVPETTAELTTAEPTQVQTEAPVVVAPIVEQEDEYEQDDVYVQDFPEIEEQPVEDNGQDYVLNNNTYKFHYPSCASAKRIKAENREDYYGTREDLISWGYDPCGNCHP